MDAFIRDVLEDNCKGQAVNPDISGIGVRLSFYIQNFVLGELQARLSRTEEVDTDPSSVRQLSS